MAGPAKERTHHAVHAMDFGTWPDLFVVDVEGNGASPPDLIEVAALPIRDGRPDTSTAGAWLIRPPRPVTPRAAHVHGLTNDRLSAAPQWRAVSGEVHAMLSTAWICAHNAHTDYRVLSAHLPEWQPAGVLDTLRLAKATHPGLSGYSLDALTTHLAPDLTAAPATGRHRATYDACATAQLLITMAAHYETWDQLISAAVPPALPGA
ncbi:3'-5' exonuclease, partial [Streptomyces sp. IBSBF 2435]|uniref:3'-5' exonuclease n=1 Tax=Streptomyces sp. IBSBF 2435 TaxID=2903531 RepID=UPI002FDBCD91